MRVGFAQALGTSVCLHPLSLLSSANVLIKPKCLLMFAHMCVSLRACVCVCVCAREHQCYHSQRPLDLGLMSPGGVKSQGGDSYNIAQVSHGNTSQLSGLCDFYFGIRGLRPFFLCNGLFLCLFGVNHSALSTLTR